VSPLTPHALQQTKSGPKLKKRLGTTATEDAPITPSFSVRVGTSFLILVWSFTIADLTPLSHLNEVAISELTRRCYLW